MRGLGQARGFSCSVIGNLSSAAATIVAFAFINGALLRRFRVSGSGPTRDARNSGKNIRIRSPLTAMADYPHVFRALEKG